MLDPISLALMAAKTFAPSLIGNLLGDKAEDVAEDVIGIATKITGISDPNEAMTSITADPNLRLEYEKELLTYNVALAQEDTKRLEAVNATMQTEAKSEHWPQWSWRPFNGFMFGLTLFMNYGFPPIVNMFHKVSATHLVPGVIPEFVFMAWASVLGVTAWHRGVNKRIESGEAPKTAVGKLKGLVSRTLG